MCQYCEFTVEGSPACQMHLLRPTLLGFPIQARLPGGGIVTSATIARPILMRGSAPSSFLRCGEPLLSIRFCHQKRLKGLLPDMYAAHAFISRAQSACKLKALKEQQTRWTFTARARTFLFSSWHPRSNFRMHSIRSRSSRTFACLSSAQKSNAVLEINFQLILAACNSCQCDCSRISLSY